MYVQKIRNSESLIVKISVLKKGTGIMQGNYLTKTSNRNMPCLK